METAHPPNTTTNQNCSTKPNWNIKTDTPTLPLTWGNFWFLRSLVSVTVRMTSRSRWHCRVRADNQGAAVVARLLRSCQSHHCFWRLGRVSPRTWESPTCTHLEHCISVIILVHVLNDLLKVYVFIFVISTVQLGLCEFICWLRNKFHLLKCL